MSLWRKIAEIFRGATGEEAAPAPQDGANYSALEYNVVDTRPKFSENPQLFFLRRNGRRMLNSMALAFEELYCCCPKAGVELEFYLYGGNSDVVLPKMQEALVQMGVDVLGLEAEKGENQFELKTAPYGNMARLADDLILSRETIGRIAAEHGLEADFSAKPREGDCGSSLQVNISLWGDDVNLFARNGYGEDGDESKQLLYSVAGLNATTNHLIPLYVAGIDCMARYGLEDNRRLHAAQKYSAPTHISWGVNNRTASIRIPTPKTGDLSRYMSEDASGRRIEFRVPSAASDPVLVLLGVLYGVLYGLHYKNMPMEKTSFNVFDFADSFKPLEMNFPKAMDGFRLDYDVLRLLC